MVANDVGDGARLEALRQLPPMMPQFLRKRRAIYNLSTQHSYPVMVQIEQAIYDLWMARDDAHVEAWRAAGLEGPAMAALTQVWSGR